MSKRTHQAVRMVVDFGGLAAFAIGYLMTRDLIQATWWLVGGSALSLAVGFAFERRVAPMPLMAGGAALLFGALTIVFNNPDFVKAKPTVVNLIFAGLLAGGMIAGKNPLKMLLGESVRLPDDVWRTLTLRYAVFFVAMAALNVVVWKTQPEAVWVLFRFPGLLLLALLFSVAQAPLMMKHMKGEPDVPPPVD